MAEPGIGGRTSRLRPFAITNPILKRRSSRGLFVRDERIQQAVDGVMGATDAAEKGGLRN